jgi:hypothetical protein
MEDATHNSGRTLAICDAPASVEFLLRPGKDRQRIDHWLALTPPAALALSERGLDYLIADDFFDEAELLGDLDERLNHQVEWALWVDDFLRGRIPEFRQGDLSPALAFFLQCKTFFDRLRVQRFSLSAVLSAYRPAQVLWVSTYAPIMRERHLIGAHYADLVLPALARELGVNIRIFSQKRADPALPPGRTNLLARSWGAFKRSQAVKLVKRARRRYQGWRLAQNRRGTPGQTGLPAAAKVLVLQDMYDMGYVLPELMAAGVQLVYPKLTALREKAAENRESPIRAALQDAWEEVIREEEFWSPLEGWEPGREVAKYWLHGIWHQAFLQYLQGFKRSTEYLARDTYHAVMVASTHGLDPYETGIGFLAAARKRGIPIFTSLHGTLPGYCHQPMQVFWDMPFSDYHFVYGPAVAEYLNEVAGRYPTRRATALAGGSMMLDACYQAQDPGKAARLRHKLAGADTRPLILYVPDFLFYFRRLSGDGCACMPYFELQKQVMEVFAQFPQVRVVYRSFPSQWTDLVPNLAKSRLADLIIATHRDYRLSELMWAVDGIILDYPATPLGEVLLTKKPLVVFSDRRYFKMIPEAKTLLAKRARMAETPAEYLSAIRQFLAEGDFKEIESPDNEFRRRYITDGHEGQVARHIAGKILQVISGKTP